MTTLTDTRRQLIALAVKHSDQPFLSRRYRMVATALANLERYSDYGSIAANLRASIAKLLAEIEQKSGMGFTRIRWRICGDLHDDNIARLQHRQRARLPMDARPRRLSA